MIKILNRPLFSKGMEDTLQKVTIFSREKSYVITDGLAQKFLPGNEANEDPLETEYKPHLALPQKLNFPCLFLNAFRIFKSMYLVAEPYLTVDGGERGLREFFLRSKGKNFAKFLGLEVEKSAF